MIESVRIGILVSSIAFAGCVSPPATNNEPDNRPDPTVQLENTRTAAQHMRIPVLLREKDLPGLLAMLSDPDAGVVAAAAEALIKLDNPAAALHLEQRLDKTVTAVLLEIESGFPPSSQPLYSLVYAVLHFTRPESAHILARAARLPFSRVRKDSIKGIRLSRNPDRFIYLREAFNSLIAAGAAPDADAKEELPEYMIIDAIGRIRTPEALEFLLQILQHDRADLRLRAGRAIAPYHDIFPERFDPLRFRITGEEEEK